MSLQASIIFAQALGVLDSPQTRQIYWAGRTTLLSDPDHIPIYDRVFAGLQDSDPPETPSQTQRAVLDSDDSPEPEDDTSRPDPSSDSRPDITIRYSRKEVLSEKDFAEYSPEELAEATRLFAQLRLSAPSKPSRRLKPWSRSHGPLDMRRTVRRCLSSSGELIRWYHSQPRRRQRRLVLLLDVSGSMSSYVRALLRFATTAVSARQRVEVFAVGTRLTRLTRELSTRDPDVALELAAVAGGDWSGGTRLGDALAEFNIRWGIPGMARGAVIVILSDGWDRGDPQVIAEQMERLQRVANRVIWVNPLKATPEYAPLARGMAAALPHIDSFVEGHNFTALEDLAAEIRQ